MGTDRSANGVVEKCLLLGKKLEDGALTLTISIFIDLKKTLTVIRSLGGR